MKWLRSDDEHPDAPEVVELRAVRDDLKAIANDLRMSQWGYSAALQKLRDEESAARGRAGI